MVKQVEDAIGISNVYSVESDWQQMSPTAISTAVAQGWWADTAKRFNFADAYTADSRNEGSGAMRRARSCGVLKLRQGIIDARTMMALLSDHADGYTPDEDWQTAVQSGIGICRHPETDGSGGCTAASLVAELCSDGSRLPIYWCSLYSPCLSLFLPIFLEGDLPNILTIGDATPCDESPWWLFHKLNQLVLHGPEDAAALVRTHWQPLQDELFASVHELARQATALMDDGRRQEVVTELSHYMAQNAERMVEVIKELHTELRREAVVV